MPNSPLLVFAVVVVVFFVGFWFGRHCVFPAPQKTFAKGENPSPEAAWRAAAEAVADWRAATAEAWRAADNWRAAHTDDWKAAGDEWIATNDRRTAAEAVANATWITAVHVSANWKAPHA